MFFDDVTIYNKYRDGQTEKWKRTVLHGAVWLCAQETMVVIPKRAGAEYRTPLQWTWDGFTLRPGDFMVRGDAAHDITRSPSELKTRYEDVLSIGYVRDCDVAFGVAHWEVSGK